MTAIDRFYLFAQRLSVRLVCALCVLVVLLFGTMPSVDAITSEQRKALLYNIYYFNTELDPCSEDALVVSGSASDLLKKQSNLDPRWIDIITKSAAKAGADPLALASVLFWENRRFPEFGPGHTGSDNVGRGPWQIIKSTWNGHASILPPEQRNYLENVYKPEVATIVAADIVKDYGGVPGVAIGSIQQNFGRSNNRPINQPSIATFAKNYNAGTATWRQPGSAPHLAAGNNWMDGSRGAWENFVDGKDKIIDDYIVAASFVYYNIATGKPLGPANTDDFVAAGLANQAKMTSFVFRDSSSTDIANAGGLCPAGGTTSTNAVVKKAIELSWEYPFGKNSTYDRTNRRTSPLTPKSNYTAAVHAFNPGGFRSYQGADCGVFVSTVMRSSKADPKYPSIGTSVQMDYVLAQKDKKYHIETLTQTSQLKDGDILVLRGTAGLFGGSGHTLIYTGKPSTPHGYVTASASWGARMPNLDGAGGLFDDPRGKYTIARLK